MSRLSSDLMFRPIKCAYLPRDVEFLSPTVSFGPAQQISQRGRGLESSAGPWKVVGFLAETDVCNGEGNSIWLSQSMESNFMFVLILMYL